jgi:hypothetical protein
MESVTTDTGISLSRIAEANIDDLVAEASPALRATLERCFLPQSLENPAGFQSFIDADI